MKVDEMSVDQTPAHEWARFLEDSLTRYQITQHYWFADEADLDSAAVFYASFSDRKDSLAAIPPSVRWRGLFLRLLVNLLRFLKTFLGMKESVEVERLAADEELEDAEDKPMFSKLSWYLMDVELDVGFDILFYASWVKLSKSILSNGLQYRTASVIPIRWSAKSVALGRIGAKHLHATRLTKRLPPAYHYCTVHTLKKGFCGSFEPTRSKFHFYRVIIMTTYCMTFTALISRNKPENKNWACCTNPFCICVRDKLYQPQKPYLSRVQ